MVRVFFFYGKREVLFFEFLSVNMCKRSSFFVEVWEFFELLSAECRCDLADSEVVPENDVFVACFHAVVFEHEDFFS